MFHKAHKPKPQFPNKTTALLPTAAATTATEGRKKNPPVKWATPLESGRGEDTYALYDYVYR